jgi:hypothetical protein
MVTGTDTGSPMDDAHRSANRRSNVMTEDLR